jgi:hypothetical protein
MIKGSFEHLQDWPHNSFSIIHAYRARSGKASHFFVWRIDYNRDTKAWADNALDLPKETATILRLGSGASKITGRGKGWSQSVYSELYDTLKKETDPLSGGAPQVTAIYTKGPARPIGIWHEGRRYLNGLPIIASASNSTLEWRDRLFQRVDGDGGAPLQNARRFAPLKIG